jgi:hypothetical protein
VNADVNDFTLSPWQQATREKRRFAFTIAHAVPLEARVERLPTPRPWRMQ